MSAYVNEQYSREGKTIEDYINNNIGTIEGNYYNGGNITENSPILNIVMENGIQPDKNNMVLRSLYPGLFDACLNHLKQKKPSTVFIYKEEGKPDVYNLFIRRTSGSLNDKKMSNARRFINNCGLRRFAFVSEEDTSMVYSMKYHFSYGYYFYKFNKPEERENLLETVYGEELPF